MKRSLTITCMLMVALSATAGTVGTYTPMTGTVNWASIKIINELSTVASEIASVYDDIDSVPFGQEYMGTNVVGGNAGASAYANPEYTRTNWFYAAMQDLVVSIVYDSFASSFGCVPTNTIVEGNTNVVISDIIYDGNWTNFSIVAGISSNGWRRCTTNWPSNWRDFDDPAYEYTWSYGTPVSCTEGDILGPWVVDDIQRSFDALKLWFVSYSWDFPSTNTYLRTGYGADSVWFDAVAEHAATFPVGGADGPAFSSPPRTLLTARKPSGYTISSSTRIAYGKINNGVMTNGISKTVSFFAYGDVSYGWPESEFDDNGVGVQYRTHHEWGSITNPATTSSVVYSTSPLGTLNEPNMALQPSSGSDTHNGYLVLENPYALLEFEWSYTR